MPNPQTLTARSDPSTDIGVEQGLPPNFVRVDRGAEGVPKRVEAEGTTPVSMVGLEEYADPKVVDWVPLVGSLEQDIRSAIEEVMQMRFAVVDRKLDDMCRLISIHFDGLTKDVLQVREVCSRAQFRAEWEAQVRAQAKSPRDSRSRTKSPRDSGGRSKSPREILLRAKSKSPRESFRSNSSLAEAGTDPTHRPSFGNTPTMDSEDAVPRVGPTELDGAAKTAERGAEQKPNVNNHMANAQQLILNFKSAESAASGSGKAAAAVWNFLEDPDSSTAAWWYPRLETAAIMLSVVATLMTTMEIVPFNLELYPIVVMLLVFDGLFITELLVRYGVCRSFWLFITSPYNIIDFLAATLSVGLHLPCLIGAMDCAGDGTVSMTKICVLPVLRLLKVLRHFQQFHLFLFLARDIKEALFVLLLLLGVLILSFASLVYLVEPRDSVPTFPLACYFVVVTISTVGYGDFSPDTTLGYFFVSCLIIVSILFMALPLGIIGNAFTKLWEDRDKMMLMLRTKDRLKQWGYTAEDMRALFAHFDSNNDGEIDLHDFSEMMKEMRIGIKKDRVVDLFDNFDKDGSGSIDCGELTRALFPQTYHVQRQSILGPEAEGDLPQGTD